MISIVAIHFIVVVAIVKLEGINSRVYRSRFIAFLARAFINNVHPSTAHTRGRAAARLFWLMCMEPPARSLIISPARS